MLLLPLLLLPLLLLQPLLLLPLLLLPLLLLPLLPLPLLLLLLPVPQDLNVAPHLEQLEDATFAGCLLVNGVQYLTQLEVVMGEVRPGGPGGVAGAGEGGWEEGLLGGEGAGSGGLQQVACGKSISGREGHGGLRSTAGAAPHVSRAGGLGG
jgi:hypothetical protein